MNIIMTDQEKQISVLILRHDVKDKLCSLIDYFNQLIIDKSAFNADYRKHWQFGFRVTRKV